MSNIPVSRAPVRDLKDLVAWQVAMDFAAGVYAGTRGFPDDEKFGLRMQLRRSAVSVASNIAEGHGRINRREYARFVLIARGSLKEAETQLLLALRLGFMEQEIVQELLALALRINKLLTGLKRRLREQG
jgi:four helix bundle protein